jgi:hypothetical protein
MIPSFFLSFTFLDVVELVIEVKKLKKDKFSSVVYFILIYFWAKYHLHFFKLLNLLALPYQDEKDIIVF